MNTKMSNKFLISILTSFILFLSAVTAASYEQTAADVSPGVFSDGDYFFPTSVSLGVTEDPASSSTYALYVSTEDNAYDYGIQSYAYDTSYAILGRAEEGIGVYGYSIDQSGVYGITDSTETTYAGVKGVATEGAPGVYGYDSSGSGIGVKAYSAYYGFYTSGPAYGLYVAASDSVGVKAYSDGTGGSFNGDNYGVYATSDSYGVYATGGTRGLFAQATDTDTSGSTTGHCAIGAKSPNDVMSYVGCEDYGFYTSDNIKVGSCSGCDVAEHFLGDNLEAGDVVILDPTKVRGVTKTTMPYNKLAAGIISTNPTMTMGLDEGFPIALAGVVPTKVIGTVHVGDLLTTSSTSGYAMACADMTKCIGAVIGKAMEENKVGKGKITALVMLG